MKKISESKPDTSIKLQEKLILRLKSYLFVSDDLIARVASFIGISVEELTTMLGRLHELRVKRQEEIHRLKAQLHVQHYRCMAYQKQLEALPHGSAQREIMRGRLEGAHSHHNNTSQRLVAINQMSSQRYIAESLGLQSPDILAAPRLNEAQ